MSTLQFIQITPEQLLEAIIAGVKLQLETLKKDFKPQEPEEYLTRHEVAKLLKCDISTIHNWTAKGKLKPYGIGNRVYYKRVEIEQCLIPLR
ncbi:helix-turn-helix domain-containing protein [Flavobacterium sp.]|jgi:excisionase family DNA binding protein|uniref:helix-turn-helix domain-containing protein n=1 Tax=Flavobacterium sp. TaxID=239 RepID=UPI00286B6E4A|nr:helix-turn-helix domain-containing protein [Flavobacterium sp.]